MSGMAAAGYPLPCTFSPLHWHVNMNGFSALARAWAGTGRRARPVCAESGLSAEAICRGHRPHSKNRLRENVGLTMYIKRPDSQSFRPDRSHLTQALACPSCVRQPHHPTAFPLVLAWWWHGSLHLPSTTAGRLTVPHHFLAIGQPQIRYSDPS